MNSSFFSVMLFGLLSSFTLVGWAGSSSSIRVTAQPAGDTSGVVQLPINADRSLIKWKGTEMWQTGRHEGTVKLSEGYLSLKNGQLSGGRFVADMNSIAITDIPEDEPVPRRNLRNHLKSEDFFYVKEYPTATFEITKTVPQRANSVEVWGDLTIRDVTKRISFTVSKKSESEFHATFKIDRFAWNISYQGSYWNRVTSILDNTFVDADIYLTVQLITTSLK